jgi:PhnB protein
MPNKTSFKPAGSSTVSPYLCVKEAARAIDFYKAVFGATERMRMNRGDKIGHAELAFGETVVMLADEFPEIGFRAPRSVGGTPVQLVAYVTDVDAAVAKALNLGARLVREIKDQFYGDRSGQIEDPFGHMWHVSTHVEDVPPEELQRRMQKVAQPA